MKIMIFIPLDPTYPHIKPACMRSINALEWNDPFDIVLRRNDGCDNSKQWAKEKDYGSKHIWAREIFLKNCYDAMLTIDSDMIVPPDTITKLTNVDADVVYGLSVSRTKVNHLWMMRTGNTFVSQDYKPKEMHSFWNKVVPSNGIGNGCTLFHRKVLEAIPIHIDNQNIYNDLNFAKDAKAAGFKQMHDCRVIVGHILNDENVVWPDPDKTYRITKLEK